MLLNNVISIQLALLINVIIIIGYIFLDNINLDFRLADRLKLQWNKALGASLIYTLENHVKRMNYMLALQVV